MSTWSTCTSGFHSHFFASVMIAALEHSPFLVACVRRETKARNPSLFARQATTGPFARKLTSLALCCSCDWSDQQTATKPQTQWKRMWFGCEQPFLWGGALRDIPKNRCGGDYGEFEFVYQLRACPCKNRPLKFSWKMNRLHFVYTSQITYAMNENGLYFDRFAFLIFWGIFFVGAPKTTKTGNWNFKNWGLR